MFHTGITMAVSGKNQGGNPLVDPQVVNRTITWLQGDVPGLAVSTGVAVAFDLGENWRSYRHLMVEVSTVDSSASWDMSCNSDVLVRRTSNRAVNIQTGSTNVGSAANVTSGAVIVPHDRYLVVQVSNGAIAAQGAGAYVSVVGVPV